ncbi:hypothetical protein F4802DRAFT_594891 [Xylaria palmicola]|nr:hypothetical protein F4802DRAFT_594891 [Xylaria palmicola]
MEYSLDAPFDLEDDSLFAGHNLSVSPPASYAHLDERRTPISGPSTPQNFRFSYGNIKPEAANSVNELQYAQIPRALGTLDTAFKFQAESMLPTPTESVDPRGISQYPELPAAQGYGLVQHITHTAAQLPPWPWYGGMPTYMYEKPEVCVQGVPSYDPTYMNTSMPKRQMHSNGVLGAAAALQLVQQPVLPMQPSELMEPKSRRARQARRVKESSGPRMAMYGEKPVPVVAKGIHKCPHETCQNKRPFKRQEHLKRHIRTQHSRIRIACRFCSRDTFNRDDNFRSHIQLHTKKEGTGRTKYHPEAEAYLELLMAKTKQRKKKAGRRKAESSPTMAQQPPLQLANIPFEQAGTPTLQQTTAAVPEIDAQFTNSEISLFKAVTSLSSYKTPLV